MVTIRVHGSRGSDGNQVGLGWVGLDRRRGGGTIVCVV